MASDLRDFRIGLALTQAQMASVIGVDRAHLSRIERGERKLTPDQLLRFGTARVRAREAAIGSQSIEGERAK